MPPERPQQQSRKQQHRQVEPQLAGLGNCICNQIQVVIIVRRRDVSLVVMTRVAEMQTCGCFAAIQTEMQMRAADPRRQQHDAESNQ